MIEFKDRYTGHVTKVGIDEEKQYDNINPPHYKTASGLESINVIEEFDLNFNLGNCVKYVLRAGKKPDQPKSRDIEKAIWYLQRELKNIAK